MPSWTPSAYQRAIFEHVATGERDLVVQAYAGCGKTSTIVEASRCLPRGRRVGMTAFNARIVDKLRAQVRGVDVKTFHSFGMQTICRAFGKLEVRGKGNDAKVNTLCREAGVEDYATRQAMCDVAKHCKNSLTVKGPVTEEERPAILLAMAAATDDHGIDLPPAVEKREVFFEQVLQILEECLHPDRTRTIDFDDQIWLPVALGLSVPRYDTLFVDELQDMNPTQLALILKMQAGRVVAVGDANQAIYGFRGAVDAAVEWLAGILGADTFELPISYRCARAIVRVAQTLVPGIQAAPGAVEGIVEDVSVERLFRDAEPGDFVLSRTNAPLISTCLQFLSANKPARIQGRDIGKSLTAFVRNSRTTSVPELREYVEQWRASEVERLQREKRSPQTAIDRAECLLVLSDGARSVVEVMGRLEMLFDDDRPGIVCSTIHKAKGLEADRVWLLGASFAGCHYWTRKQVEDTQGTPEMQRALRRIREENNILYVGITRARNTLFGVQGLPRPLETT